MSASPRQSPTKPAPGPASADPRVLGQTLRQLRMNKGLTLKQLSLHSGVALSTLSKMELGQITVGYDKLAAVARALEVDIARVMGGAAVEGEVRRAGVVFARTDLRSAPRYETAQYRYALLGAGFAGRAMTPLLGRVLARRAEDFPEYIRHGGQEFVMVMEGSVAILFETGERLELVAGESGYFDSGVGHVYLSTGEGDATVLIVMHDGNASPSAEGRDE